MTAQVTTDRLYLLPNEFSDLDLPGRSFYCRHCVLLDGLLAAFPDRAANLEIVRIEHLLPRQELVDLLGSHNQWLPILVLGPEAPRDFHPNEYRGTLFVREFPVLLRALHVRHGFPEAHP